MTDLIRCVNCKYFEQDKREGEWGRCAKALDNTIPVRFYPDGDYCDAIWMAVHHDFGCVMGEIGELWEVVPDSPSEGKLVAKPADLPVSTHD